VYEFAVGKPVQARCGANALNPQAAELTFTLAAIPIRLALGSVDGLLRRLIELALSEEKAFRAAQILLAARAALRATFYSGHCISPARRSREAAWPWLRRFCAGNGAKSLGETDDHDGVERLHGVLRYLLGCVKTGSGAIWRRSIKIQID